MIISNRYYAITTITVTQALGIILCMHPANERWRYSVTPSLIGCVHKQNDPWGTYKILSCSKHTNFIYFIQYSCYQLYKKLAIQLNGPCLIIIKEAFKALAPFSHRHIFSISYADNEEIIIQRAWWWNPLKSFPILLTLSVERPIEAYNTFHYWFFLHTVQIWWKFSLLSLTF